MYAHTDRQEQMWVSLLSKKDQVMIESRPLATAPQPRLGCGQGRQRASYRTHTAFTCLLAFPTIITPSCFSGVIQQLRGPNFIQVCPPNPLVWTIVDILHTYYLTTIHTTNHGHSVYHLPSFSCPRSN